MNKIYIELKSLGSTTREPIFELDLTFGNKNVILYTHLSKEKYKVEGHLIEDFIKRVNFLDDSDCTKINYKTEKDMYLGFQDLLREEKIEQIVVEDKLKQMLLIRERMRDNKFKPESYGFRNFILSEEPDYFNSENSGNYKKNLMKKIVDAICNEK